MPFAYGKLTRFIDPARSIRWTASITGCRRLQRAQMRLRWNPARNLSIRHTMHYYVDARVAVSHRSRMHWKPTNCAVRGRSQRRESRSL